jgi:hypothetical protein
MRDQHLCAAKNIDDILPSQNSVPRPPLPGSCAATARGISRRREHFSRAVRTAHTTHATRVRMCAFLRAIAVPARAAAMEGATEGAMAGSM